MNLPEFASAKLLIVGDVMLDRYWTGDTSRISPEAPVPVVKIQQLEQRAGGAANVAQNVAALGCAATLSGITGNDEFALTLKNLLSENKVTEQLLQLQNCTTITKLRVLSRHQQLIRLDFEDHSLLSGAEQLARNSIDLMQSADVVVLSDYAKGSLAKSQQIIEAAQRVKKPVVVDPKGSDFSKYRHATILTPNQSEFEAIVGHCVDNADLESRATKLINELGLQALLITRSDKGMVLIERDKPAYYLAARSRDVYDVTGAGDTVVAVFSACIAAGEPFRHAAYLANIAAGIVVTKLGAQSVTLGELSSELRSIQPPGRGIVTEEQLLQHIGISRSNGERIVFTNGCFDLLHNGHITYLEEAAQLGDRLIVAVNNDDSVRVLKGPHRPVNTLKDRMNMLASLRAVDWVVAFSEPTPQRLIARVLPDVLVKGGDYQPVEIAGAKEVEQAGGTVKVLSFIKGYSSTELIQKIKQLD